jgi:hypothetical protein
MKSIFATVLLGFAITANAAIGGLTLAWTDTNSASAQVNRYIVYDITSDPRQVFKILDMPKPLDDPRDVQLPLDQTAAGKILTVTVMNELGLESDHAYPPVITPTIAVPPINVRLSFDFVNRVMEIIWDDQNLEAAQISEFVVYRQNAATLAWESVGRVPATRDRLAVPTPSGKETFAVVAVNDWGETDRSVSVVTPTLLVPISNLRLITVR